jgi:hypothetical protein
VVEFLRSKHSLPIQLLSDQIHIQHSLTLPPARHTIKSPLGLNLLSSLFPSPNLADRLFTVMTYNILADTLHQMTMAKYASQNAFDQWTYGSIGFTILVSHLQGTGNM